MLDYVPMRSAGIVHKSANDSYGFIRFELTSVVGSETFQFPTGLVFDHCEPIGEDREHPIFVLMG